MSKKIQLLSILVFLSLVIKSFFTNVNVLDAVNSILCILVFLVLEYTKYTKLQKELQIVRKTSNEKFKVLEKELTDTKTYMSKFSTSHALRK